MYQFGICNYFVNFETFDYLNISKVDANMKFWQIYGDLNYCDTIYVSVFWGKL
jgi:hypothetical protein